MRIILMNGIEHEAMRFSHACARMNAALQRPLAEIRRVEHHQATLVNWLIGPDHSPLETTKPSRGGERSAAKLRMQYASEADPVGSLPDPALSGIEAVLMDKLGERLAFERSGTRLYEALMVKCEAAKAPIPLEDLQHIRDEEHMHFALVGAAIQSLGGDPTAQTPAADVTGVEGMGLMQVLTDPKTTVSQALHAILVAEMTDNAAWEELMDLTARAGKDDLVEHFSKAHEEEIEHLEKVRAWYKEATLDGRS